MECPTCYEEFDLGERVPRMFSCGHTFCQVCISNFLFRNQACPYCREVLRELRRVTDFPKNFILIDMVDKKLRQKEKFDICEISSKPNTCYCQECKINFCEDCLKDHSGHKFKKICLSVGKVAEEVARMDTKVSEVQGGIKLQCLKIEKNLKEFENTKAERLGQVDKYFDDMLFKMEQAREGVKAQFTELCDSKHSQLSVCLGEYKRYLTKLEAARTKIDKVAEEVKATEYIDTEAKASAIKNKTKSLEEDLSAVHQLKKFNVKDMPKITFDRAFEARIPQMARVAHHQEKPCILYFGESKKLLIYEIIANKWTLLKMVPSSDGSSPLDFGYFGSAVTLDSGDVLITGGGISNVAAIFSPYDLKVRRVASMTLPKKEHCSVAIKDKVYTMGGYDGGRNVFLNSVEVYDVATDEWRLVAPMKKAKCSFAACKVNDNLIFVCGGFEIERRLDIIELYDCKKDEWTLLETRLPVRLSNHACISVEDNKVLVVGGGTSEGHSYDIYCVELLTKSVSKFCKMTTGRDLRNKVVCYNEEVFTIGGNPYCTSEKLCLSTKKWSTLEQYSGLVSDALDSWFSTLVMENPLLNLRNSDAMFRMVDPLNEFEDPRKRMGMYTNEEEYPFEENSDDAEGNIHLENQANFVSQHMRYALNNFEYEEERSPSDGYSYEEHPEH